SRSLSLSTRPGLRIVRSRIAHHGLRGAQPVLRPMLGHAGGDEPAEADSLGLRTERAEMNVRACAGSRASTEPTRFFLDWLQNPLTVGAVAPSGRELARLMTAGVAPGARVVELGAGTGTLTQAILERGVHPADLHIVEQNESFAAMLRGRFPSCPV